MIANPVILKALEDEERNPDSQWGGRCRPLIEAMMKINVRPALIYASIKTGRVLTTDNMNLLSREDLIEWERYCAEYEELAVQAGL
jgi:hypothetical protein